MCLQFRVSLGLCEVLHSEGSVKSTVHDSRPGENDLQIEGSIIRKNLDKN